MKIAHKLALALTIPTILLFLIGIFGWHSLKSQNESIKTIYLDRVIPLRDLKEIADAYAVSIIDAVNKTNAGLMPAQDTLRAVQKAQELVEKKWSGYLSTYLTDEEKKLAQETDKLLKDFQPKEKKLIKFLESKQGLIPGQLTDFDGELYVEVDPISDHISALIELQLRVVKDEYSASNSLFNNDSWINFCAIICSILMSSIAGYLIIKKLISQLGGEPAYAVYIANEIARGNLVVTIGDAPEGSLINAMKKMSRELTVIITSVKSSSENILESSLALEQMSSKSISELANQQRETELVASAMHEMSATVTEVARNAQGASAGTVNADSEVSEGNNLVNDAIHSIHDLSNGVEETSVAIATLANDSEEIGKVIEVIRNIASQTNLLALNAAIEAARAGEQGRGFAVVADEVRTLAARTQESTENIQDMIQRLQKGVSNAVETMGRSRIQARETVELSGKTQSALASIKSSISQISDVNMQIAAATEEQTMVAEEIHRNIVNISKVTDLSVETADLVKKSSQGLVRTSEVLREQVSHFVLHSTPQNTNLQYAPEAKEQEVGFEYVRPIKKNIKDSLVSPETFHNQGGNFAM